MKMGIVHYWSSWWICKRILVRTRTELIARPQSVSYRYTGPWLVWMLCRILINLDIRRNGWILHTIIQDINKPWYPSERMNTSYNNSNISISTTHTPKLIVAKTSSAEWEKKNNHNRLENTNQVLQNTTKFSTVNRVQVWVVACNAAISCRCVNSGCIW